MKESNNNGKTMQNIAKKTQNTSFAVTGLDLVAGAVPLAVETCFKNVLLKPLKKLHVIII